MERVLTQKDKEMIQKAINIIQNTSEGGLYDIDMEVIEYFKEMLEDEQE